MIQKSLEERDFIDVFYEQWKQKGVAGEPFDRSTLFLFRVMRLAAALERTLVRLCAQYDMTWAQFQALAALRRLEPRSLTAGEIMDACILTSGSVTNLITQLQKKGFIERKQSTDDKRQIQISLTKKGAEIFDKVQKRRMKELTSYTKKYNPKERDEVSLLLKRLLVELDQRRD